MIRCVIFDWNGTLLADTKPAVIGLNAVLKQFGKPEVSVKTYRDIMDIPVRELYLKCGFTDDEIERHGSEFQKIFLDTYGPYEQKARLRKGSRHTLNWLMNQGADVVLVSNHIKNDIERQLDRLKISQFFSHVYANDDKVRVLRARTKGDKMIDYIKRKGYKKNEVINVGDAPEEVHMAREAGVMSVGITDGFYSTKRLRAEKPDYLITNMEQLINIVQRENQS